jgi:hypothetical protein
MLLVREIRVSFRPGHRRHRAWIPRVRNRDNVTSSAYPAGGSRKHPRTPVNPHNAGPEAVLTGGVPAYPRSAQKRQDRPVTPEVAGSSPVAPVSRSACNWTFLLS